MTYSSYLQLREILTAQIPRSEGQQDEMLFIIIHQTYELWFKELLHEGLFLEQNLRRPHCLQQCMLTLKRMRTVVKTLVGQVDILETMTPMGFSSFRSLLATSSGLQSKQFRLLEAFLGGQQMDAIVGQYRPEDELDTSTARDVLIALQEGKNLPGALKTFLSTHLQSSEEMSDLCLKAYRHHPDLTAICELFLDLDEGFQEWRYRHVKMVERTIGTLPGTGGSSGVSYLKKTLFKPFLPELWSIRDQL